MMKQGLSIGATQQLQLTPKLQQAIHMLQLSSQELEQEIRMIVTANILLEAEDTLTVTESQLPPPSDSVSAISLETTASAYTDKENTDSVDIDWDSNYKSQPSSSSNEATSISSIIDRCHQANDSLQDTLRWQLNLSPLSEAEHTAAEIIIDAIDDNGFLQISLTEVQESLKEWGYQLSSTHIEKVLKHVQTLGPTGVGARNLQECLLLQLNALQPETPEISLAKTIISKHIQLLAHHNHFKLSQLCKVSPENIETAVKIIHRLNPRPGNAISGNNLDTIVPDVMVKKTGGTWQVSLNKLTTPTLRLNQDYMSMLDNANAASQQFINSHLQEARWLMKCLHNRNETLLKVAACIMKHQQAFLTHGVGALKPLILKEIADDLGMHQSTISRVTTRKYIQTPRGTFELKYFFTSHLNTCYGQQCSAKAIQTYIKTLIKSENPTRPLSDQMISKKLLDQGIQVARRTVAKYRELIGVPAANERRVIY